MAAVPQTQPMPACAVEALDACNVSNRMGWWSVVSRLDDTLTGEVDSFVTKIAPTVVAYDEKVWTCAYHNWIWGWNPDIRKTPESGTKDFEADYILDTFSNIYNVFIERKVKARGKWQKSDEIEVRRESWRMCQAAIMFIGKHEFEKDGRASAFCRLTRETQIGPRTNPPYFKLSKNAEAVIQAFWEHLEKNTRKFFDDDIWVREDKVTWLLTTEMPSSPTTEEPSSPPEPGPGDSTGGTRSGTARSPLSEIHARSPLSELHPQYNIR